MNHRIPPDRRVFACAVPFLITILTAAVLLNLASCAGVEEPAAEPPEPPRQPERIPIAFDWAGTTWILPDPAATDPEARPDYRGFHLGRDGRLLLVNLDGATGDSWSAEGNMIRLNLLEGTADIPMEGEFLAFAVDEENDAGGKGAESGSDAPASAPAGSQADSPRIAGIPARIRLIPENAPDSEGLVFRRAGVDKDLVFNHWVPMTMLGGDTVHWPINREIHLMLLSDGKGGLGVLGYGGVNRFHGPVTVGDEDFVVGAIAQTRRIGEASAFEDLYIGHIDAADRYVQVHDDLYLYEGTRFLTSFRARIFD